MGHSYMWLRHRINLVEIRLKWLVGCCKITSVLNNMLKSLSSNVGTGELSRFTLQRLEAINVAFMSLSMK